MDRLQMRHAIQSSAPPQAPAETRSEPPASTAPGPHRRRESGDAHGRAAASIGRYPASATARAQPTRRCSLPVAALSLLLWALVSLGCGEPSRPADDPSASATTESPATAESPATSPEPLNDPPAPAALRGEPPVVEPDAPFALLAHADARVLDPALGAALAGGPLPLRMAAVTGLARLRDPDAGPLLLRALRDPSPAVRVEASFGLGLLGADAPDASVTALTAAIAAEVDPAVRAVHLHDLGKLAPEAAASPLLAALASSSARERAGACRAHGELVRRGRPLAGEARTRVLEAASTDPATEVRRACAFVLSRATPPSDASEREVTASRLSHALGDPDPVVLAFLLRALTRQTDVPASALLPLLQHDDAGVRVQATRALGARAQAHHEPQAIAAMVRRVTDQLLASGRVTAGPPLHLYLAALEAASPLARDGAVFAAAEASLARLAAASSDEPRDQGVAHCAAAHLVDLGRGWPSRVERCGGRVVSEPERRVHAAQILGAVEGSEPQRGVYLQRLLGDASSTVRQAALSSLGGLGTPQAHAAILRTLETDADLGVRIAGLEALRDAYARRAAARAAAVLAGTDPGGDDWPSADVRRVLRVVGEALLRDGALEGLTTLVAAISDLGMPELADVVQPLATHANAAVRAEARAVLRGAGLALPDAPVAPQPAPLSAHALATSPRGVVTLETNRGAIALQLLPDAAPGTVARFVERVASGFYDGLTFHRVVPGFVAQGGDPRGDGYGGPPDAQRCELSRLPYERGVVGMALAGPDTGGSQFFVTLEPQPHLDGRYTVFARVTEGMEHADALVPGDRILRARFVPD